jgi:hypothetical protein
MPNIPGSHLNGLCPLALTELPFLLIPLNHHFLAGSIFVNR